MAHTELLVMQVGSGTNDVFPAHSAGMGEVGGLVASHAAYCERVTSVMSMENPTGSISKMGAGKPSRHSSFGPMGSVHGFGGGPASTPASVTSLPPGSTTPAGSAPSVTS